MKKREISRRPIEETDVDFLRLSAEKKERLKKNKIDYFGQDELKKYKVLQEGYNPRENDWDKKILNQWEPALAESLQEMNEKTPGTDDFKKAKWRVDYAQERVDRVLRPMSPLRHKIEKMFSSEASFLLVELLKDFSLKEKLRTLVKKGMEDDVDSRNGNDERLVVEFLRLVSEGLIDDEFLSYIFEAHIKAAEERKKEMEQKAEEIKNDFMKKVFDEIDEGNFDIKKETAKLRLNDFLIIFNDNLGSSSNVIAKADLWHVELPLYTKESELKQIMFHELTHVIGGRRLNLLKIDTFEIVESHKGGLRFTIKEDEGSDRDVVFHWLNEAITDIISERLYGEGYNKNYHYARHLLIKELGFGTDIPEELFFKAYFENRTKGNKNHGESSAFLSLVKAVHEKKGKGKLFELHKKYQATGFN